jgi:hypothetical protein
MNRHVRRTLVAAVGLLALGGTFLAFRRRPVLVETEQVTRGRFEAVVEEDGRTRVRERHVGSAPVAGRLLRLGVRAGDVVGRDDPVALIQAAPSALVDLPAEPSIGGPRELCRGQVRLSADDGSDAVEPQADPCCDTRRRAAIGRAERPHDRASLQPRRAVERHAKAEAKSMTPG